MKVIIKSATVSNQRSGTNGKSYGEQQAALDHGGDFPLAFKLNVEAAFPKLPGIYSLSGSSFGTDKYGNLTLSRVQLEGPLTSAPAKA